MARHEPPSTVQEFGVAMSLSTIPDALTGGPLLPPSVFESGEMEDRLVYFMGQDSNGWPIITTEASVIKHLESIRDAISDHVDTTTLQNEAEHRELILAMAHVRGLVWKFNKYNAILRFGYQHLFKFDPMTWYAELEMGSHELIPFVQEFLVVSMLTHTATFSCVAKITRGSNALIASSRIMQVAMSRALGTLKSFDSGDLKIYILPSPASQGSTVVKFQIVLHWVPNIDDADAIGVSLEEEGSMLQTLHLCQMDPGIKTKSLKSSEKQFIARLQEGVIAIQGAVQDILCLDGGIAAYGFVREFDVSVDDVDTFYHTSFSRDDMLCVHMNSRPVILSREFYSIGYPSYTLYRITGPVTGGMFPSHFAEHEETHHLFGAQNKQVASKPV